MCGGGEDCRHGHEGCQEKVDNFNSFVISNRLEDKVICLCTRCRGSFDYVTRRGVNELVERVKNPKSWVHSKTPYRHDPGRIRGNDMNEKLLLTAREVAVVCKEFWQSMEVGKCSCLHFFNLPCVSTRIMISNLNSTALVSLEFGLV